MTIYLHHGTSLITFSVAKTDGLSKLTKNVSNQNVNHSFTSKYSTLLRLFEARDVYKDEQITCNKEITVNLLCWLKPKTDD